MSHSPIVQFESVSIVRNGRTALDDVSLSIERGENVAILGPNGCGKSTLVKAISCELRPFAGRGSVQVHGLDRWNVFDLRKTLGIVSNDLQALCAREEKVIDLVVSGFFGSYGVLEPYEVSEEQWAFAHDRLAFLDAAHLADRPMNELSSGETRRALIARALVHSPGALLLDEPTTSLDIKSAHLLLETLRRVASHGTNLLLVTHHVEELVPEITRVILLKNGRIFLDGPTDWVMTSNNLSELYEAPVQLSKSCGIYRAAMENAL